MPFRIGVVDLVAAGLVTVLVLLPARATSVQDTFDDAVANDISAAQSVLAEHPGDGEAASNLALTLLRENQSDWALRAAQRAASAQHSVTRWKSLWAISSVQGARFNVAEALSDAKLALEACEDKSQRCPEHQHIRLQLWVGQLDRGLKSGIDPKLEPERFKKAMRNAFPHARIPGP